MPTSIRHTLSLLVLLLGSVAACVWASGQHPRLFEIEWDEEVQLHDGRMMVVHVKRSFERRSLRDKWLAHDRDTEITFDAGPPWGRFKRNFERYDVTMIEHKDGNWYIGLQLTTGIPPTRLVDPAYPVLVLGKDGVQRPAQSWKDIPDFPRLNIMPITPSAEGVLPFANSRLGWQTKMAHWKNHPRAAGDNGVIIQRHAREKEQAR